MKYISVSLALVGPLLGAALVSGCVVAPAPGYYRAGVVVSEVEPPPPRYEVVGVAPAPGYLWIGGAWLWESTRLNSSHTVTSYAVSCLQTKSPLSQSRSEEHTSELQSHSELVCRFLIAKKKITRLVS